MWCHRACKVGTNAVVLSRPTKCNITKRSRRRRASSQIASTSSAHRISSPDSPQDRRAVAAAFCSAGSGSETSGLVTIGDDDGGERFNCLETKRKPILFSSRSLDEQDQKSLDASSKAGVAPSPRSNCSTDASADGGFTSASELHRAGSIPAIIVGEIPKLIVTASNDNAQPAMKSSPSALIVVDNPHQHQ